MIAPSLKSSAHRPRDYLKTQLIPDEGEEREVAFLFTDIEGSTRLIAKSEQAYRAMLSQHHAILRSECASRGAFEFHDAGDGLYFAFDQAEDAAAAATSIQRVIASDWSTESDAPPVKIALHWASSEFRDRQYRGPSIHLAARLLAAAHGGQILCSNAFLLVAIRSIPLAHFQDLGSFLLRGFQSPETIFQLNGADENPRSFPALHANTARRHNLPPTGNPMIGRASELAEISRILGPGTSNSKILTISGPGGVGKTRLALAVARQLLPAYDHGVVYISCVAIRHADALPRLILEAIDVHPESSWDYQAELAKRLHALPTLFLFDNLEHIAAEGATVIHQLASLLPEAKFLITSRSRLGLLDEQEFPISPTLPPDSDDPAVLRESDAVKLFLTRTQQARPGFDASENDILCSARICRLVGGLALAIELAASRTQILSLGELAEALESDQDTLDQASNGDDRTLRDVFHWSCRLLPPEIAEFFYTLSVFRGGWNAEAAARLTTEKNKEWALGYLHYLLTCSLVQSAQTSSGMRFTMLEPIRQLSKSMLPSDQLDSAVKSHFKYFHRRAWEMSMAFGTAEEIKLTQQLKSEVPNILAAFKREAEPIKKGRLAISFYLYALYHGHASELRSLMEPLPECGAEPAELAKIWQVAGTLDMALLRNESARHTLEKSKEFAVDSRDANLVQLCLHNLALNRERDGDIAGAISQFEQALEFFEENGSPSQCASVLCNLGNLKATTGNSEASFECLTRAANLFRAEGDSGRLSMTLNSLGNQLCRLGDLDAARGALLESLEVELTLNRTQPLPNLLASLALLSCRLSALESALFFVGATENIARNHALTLDETTQAELDEAIATAARVLSDDESVAHLQRGKSGSPDDWLSECNMLFHSQRSSLTSDI